MEAKFVNGSSVSVAWSDDSIELIAAFAYEMQAIKFAQLMASDETRPSGRKYIVCCHYNGNVTIVRPPETVAKAA